MLVESFCLRLYLYLQLLILGREGGRKERESRGREGRKEGGREGRREGEGGRKE